MNNSIKQTFETNPPPNSDYKDIDINIGPPIEKFKIKKHVNK